VSPSRLLRSTSMLRRRRSKTGTFVKKMVCRLLVNNTEYICHTGEERNRCRIPRAIFETHRAGETCREEIARHSRAEEPNRLIVLVPLPFPLSFPPLLGPLRLRSRVRPAGAVIQEAKSPSHSSARLRTWTMLLSGVGSESGMETYSMVFSSTA